MMNESPPPGRADEPSLAELLTAYADGEVSGAEQRVVEAALAGSRDASTQLRSEESLKALLSGLPMPELPPTAMAGIFAGVEAGLRQERRARFARVGAAIAAAAVAAILFVVPSVWDREKRIPGTHVVPAGGLLRIFGPLDSTDPSTVVTGDTSSPFPTVPGPTTPSGSTPGGLPPSSREGGDPGAPATTAVLPAAPGQSSSTSTSTSLP